MASETMVDAENMLRDSIFEEFSVMTDTTAGLSPRSSTGEGIIDSALVDDFDPNLLRELGDVDQDPVEFGESLQADLATRFQKILLEGLKKETKEELIKKYPFPKNVPLAKGPALNPEIAAMLNEVCKQRDKRLLTKQDQLGKAISALGKALTGLLKKTPDIPDIIRTLNDAGMLLSDSHFAETDTRRSVIMPLIDKSFTDSLKNRKRDIFLFGEKLGDLVKDSRGLKKTGQLMQPSASTNTNLNGKGPSSRGARQQRGGHSYRYYRGGGPRLATTAQPYPYPYQYPNRWRAATAPPPRRRAAASYPPPAPARRPPPLAQNSSSATNRQT
jgi:hypothetical protein